MRSFWLILFVFCSNILCAQQPPNAQWKKFTGKDFDLMYPATWIAITSPPNGEDLQLSSGPTALGTDKVEVITIKVINKAGIKDYNFDALRHEADDSLRNTKGATYMDSQRSMFKDRDTYMLSSMLTGNIINVKFFLYHNSKAYIISTTASAMRYQNVMPMMQQILTTMEMK
jgi:hypothetical protein